VTGPSPTIPYGQPIPTLTPIAVGFVNGDTAATLTTQATCTTTATSLSTPGTYAVTCNGAVGSNYTYTYKTGTLTVTKATTILTVTPNPPAVNQATTLTATVHHTGGGAAPAGTVSFYDVTTLLGSAAVQADGTATLVTTFGGGPHPITATYSGDANNPPVTSGCQVVGEQVTTTKAQPSIGTTPSAGGTVGTVVNDTATVSGGYSPTGDVTFKLYAPGDTTCVSAIQTFANVTLSGLTATSGNYTTAAVGIYRWTATYNGNANNLTATSGCQDEQVTTTTQVAAAVTLPKAGAGPQQQGSSAPGGGGPLGSGIAATLLLALIGSVLFALRRRQSGEAEEPKA